MLNSKTADQGGVSQQTMEDDAQQQLQHQAQFSSCIIEDKVQDNKEEFKEPSTSLSTPRFVRKWGAYGGVFRTQRGQFDGPYSVAVHPLLDVVVVGDSRDLGVQTFRSDGVAWGADEVQLDASGQRLHRDLWGQSVHAIGIAVHPTRNVVVIGDSSAGRVLVCAMDGTLIRGLDFSSINPPAGGVYMQPFGVSVHPTRDLIYVCDPGNRRVCVFTLKGAFVKLWNVRESNHGHLLHPHGVAAHPSLDLLFVSASDGYSGNCACIQVFTLDGDFLFQWGSKGSELGQLEYPCNIALHSRRGLLFVVDHGNNRIQVFDLEGHFVRQWGSYGEEDGQFLHPDGIAVDEVRDVVYTVERANHRVQMFSLSS